VRNVTISLDDEVARWTRRQAAEADTSVSKYISRIIEQKMRASDSYWRAFEQWKKRDRDLGVKIDASKRFTRDQAHERR
jgi:hypothetical protein